VRLLFVSGGAFQADWIEFTWTTPIARPTWSAVKQLFR
jgi:hypothetical protein